MAQVFTNATLVLADRLLPQGWLQEENGKIVRYGTGAAPEADTVIDCCGKYLSPGFIDVHCHGGGGGSFGKLETEEHVKAMKMHLKHGVTAMTPTPMTIDPQEIRKLREIKEEIDKRDDLPHHLGYFMEGPLNQPHPDMAIGAAKAPVITPDIYEPALREAKGIVNRWMAAPVSGAPGAMVTPTLPLPKGFAPTAKSNRVFAVVSTRMSSGLSVRK